jgi:hypothetical protein
MTAKVNFRWCRASRSVVSVARIGSPAATASVLPGVRVLPSVRVMRSRVRLLQVFSGGWIVLVFGVRRRQLRWLSKCVCVDVFS